MTDYYCVVLIDELFEIQSARMVALIRLQYSSPFGWMVWHLLAYPEIITCSTWVDIIMTNMTKWHYSVEWVPHCIADHGIAWPSRMEVYQRWRLTHNMYDVCPNSGAHFTSKVTARNWNPQKIYFALIVANLHTYWQLSCCGISEIVTLSNDYFSGSIDTHIIL